jgi:hypothetical protein
MKPTFLFPILVCVASVGLIGWRVHAVHSRTARHFEIVEDLSLSHADGCASLLGLAKHVLLSDGVSSDSMLTVVALGDQASANEPRQLGRFPIPFARRAMEGRSAKLRREETVLQDIFGKCKAAHRTTISPIFLAVKEAIADLRAQGCNERAHCKLSVDSDLEENVELSIKREIEKPDNRKYKLPTPINNSGVRILFCGSAVTVGRMATSATKTNQWLSRNPDGEDRLRRVWSSLFTDPETISFEPYCP